MRISLLPLPIVAVTVLALPELRADFNPAIVASDSRWVVYADLNALRENPAGEEVIATLQKQGSQAVPLPGGATVTLDVPKVLATIGSITAYGANFQRNPRDVDGTLVVQGTPDLRKIVEALLLELEVGPQSVVSDLKGLGYSAYAIVAKDKAHPELNHRVVIAFPPEGMLIVGQSPEKVQRAYDLIRGRGDSLAQSHGSDFAASAANAEHATLFAASDVPPEAVEAMSKANSGPHTRILQMTHSASVAIGDDGAKTFAHIQLVASDDDSADKLIKILQGMTAMLSLAQSNDQKLTDFINSAQATRDGDRVSFQLAYDSTQLAAMVKGILATSVQNPHGGITIGHKGPNPNVEKVLGQTVGEWKAAAPTPPASEASQPQWHEISGVKLTNGAQLTVNVTGSDGNAVSHFEAVQVKPEGDGAPLTFSRKMMTELHRPIIPSSRGSRLLQVAFPGEDGTYTLRVRYTPPAQGDVSFHVWVKNDSGSDNRASDAPQP